MADPIDVSDPCARAAALGTAYNKLLTGEHEQKVRFRNGDGEEEVTYTSPNIALLRQEWQRATADCLAKTSGRRARRCITAG